MSQEASAMMRKHGKDVFLCSDLVTARWTDAFGQRQETTVNLEEIWATGAVLQFEFPVRAGTRIWVRLGQRIFEGTVVTSKADFVGQLVEVRFSDRHRWSRSLYEPAHLLDPQTLVSEDELKDKNTRLLEEVLKSLPRRVA
jgi:hypothetical protein